jgi:hypothetical protein
MNTRVYAAVAADKPLAPSWADRRELGPKDGLMDVMFCGPLRTAQDTSTRSRRRAAP